MRILRTLLGILALQPWFAAGQAGVTQPGEALTAQQIAERLAANNRRRHQDLRGYTGQREYHLLYTGFPMRLQADMVVRIQYDAPDQKQFTIVSKSGSSLIVNRVFKRLLETEKEASDAEGQARTAVTEANYSFELIGSEDLNGRPSYILKVEPKTDNKLLYRGKIWVDAADFAVAKIEATPAQPPSFWISNTVVHHVYEKIGEFWLPEQNESTSEIRVGGHAALSIQYRDYKIVPNAIVNLRQREGGSEAADGSPPK